MILKVQDLSFGYTSDVKALEDVNFAIGDGMIVGLIGPNGSGKSTLVMNIFDLLELQAGLIEIEGYDHRSAEAKSRGLLLASNDHLPDFLTGWEYLNLVAGFYGERLDRDEAETLFSRYSMASRLDDLIEDYSHGMKKKTQLMLAFMLRRPLTVIDETLNGVDIEALFLAEKEFLAMRRQQLSLMVCSHDFPMLERIADHIVFLDRGHLVASESTDTLLASYGSLSGMVFGHLDTQDRQCD